MRVKQKDDADQLQCPFAVAPYDYRTTFYKCITAQCMAWYEVTAYSGYCVRLVHPEPVKIERVV